MQVASVRPRRGDEVRQRIDSERGMGKAWWIDPVERCGGKAGENFRSRVKLTFVQNINASILYSEKKTCNVRTAEEFTKEQQKNSLRVLRFSKNMIMRKETFNARRKSWRGD